MDTYDGTRRVWGCAIWPSNGGWRPECLRCGWTPRYPYDTRMDAEMAAKSHGYECPFPGVAA